MKKELIVFLCIICAYGVSNAQIDTISYHIYQKGGALGVGEPPSTVFGGIHLTSLNPVVRFTDTDAWAGDTYQMINNTKGNNVLNFAVYNKTDERAELSFSGDGNVVVPAGNTGFGELNPQARVQVANGDVYISDIQYGIIMRSPDGNCWKGTLDNYGKLKFELMDNCPGMTVSIGDNTVISSEQISIYPNPALDKITIEVMANQKGPLNLTIIDNLGREMENTYLNERKNTIKISHFPSGIYYITVKGENVFITDKLIKN